MRGLPGSCRYRVALHSASHHPLLEQTKVSRQGFEEFVFGFVPLKQPEKWLLGAGANSCATGNAQEYLWS